MELLKGRPGSKRGAERAEESRGTKLARYIEGQDRALQQEGAVREGASHDSNEHTVAVRGGALHTTPGQVADPQPGSSSDPPRHSAAGNSTDPAVQDARMEDTGAGPSGSHMPMPPASSTDIEDQEPQAKRMRQDATTERDADVGELVEYGCDDVKAGSTTRAHTVTPSVGAELRIDCVEKEC